MFDGFSSLLKPENTSEFSPRFSVSFSRGRRNEFSLSSLQVASGENFWGFCEAIEKSRGNRKKLVIAMLWGDGGLRSAAVEIRGPSTQNPLVATSCRFESDHRHQSKMAGAAVFTVRPPFSSKLSKFAFGGKIDKTVGFSYNINTLNVGLEEKDCCQQSRTDFYKKSRLELGIASPRQPRGCR